MTIETTAFNSDRLRFDDLRVAALIDTWSVSGPGRQLAALAQALESGDVDTMDRWIAEARAHLDVATNDRNNPSPQLREPDGSAETGTTWKPGRA